MNRKMRILSFLIALVFCAAFRLPLYADSPQPEEIKKAALESWTRYAKFISRCEAKHTEHSIDYDENGSATEDETYFSEAICKYPFYVNIGGGVGEESVSGYGVNKSYTFRIDREKESEPWEGIAADPVENHKKIYDWRYLDSWYKKEDIQVDRRDLNILKRIAPQMDAAMMPLPVLFADSEFKITESEEITEGETRKIVLSFEYDPGFPSLFSSAHKGTITLLPDHDWMVDSMELFLVKVPEEPDDDAPVEYEFRFLYRFEYDYQYRMPVVAKSLKEQYNIATGQMTRKQTAEYDIKPIGRFKYSARRFTLSYYGLPEPDFVSRLWLKYLFIAVGAVIILAALWRKLKERKDSV